MAEIANLNELTLDREVSAREVQGVSSADAVAAFFARLGYDTDNRTIQTPGNLGITAEGTARPIKKIHQIADQEGLFKVYLFELTSVTVSHTRALARSFRSLGGNYLLVLTSDFERLDFVLLERYVPTQTNGTSNIGQKQAGIRPRTLTVERRNPSRVQLRVLRRLTWTESDPFAQYEKLLSAYSVADWSEELFNNRALFSDYYLTSRVTERLEWREDSKPAYLSLRQLYQGAAPQFGGQEEVIIRRDLLEPVFKTLAFEAVPGKQAGSSEVQPDYRLYPPGSEEQALAVCLAYPWGRSLDGKDYERDKESPDENPGAIVVSLLEQNKAPWALVTNGKVWRLYSQRTHSKATNYYEIDLEEILAATGPQADPADAFRYFWLLFRRQAFEPVEIAREGKTVSLSFLDQLVVESEDYAKELGERLKARVFEEVFPHLAAGFIAHIRQRDGVGANVSQEVLDKVFLGTLTLLYRLLFLLYAESRDLLPVKEVRGYWEVSLTKLKNDIAEGAGTIEDDVPDRLKKNYRKDHTELYDRLAALFKKVDRGDSSLNVPVYNGGLFLSEPDDEDDTPEAEAARFLNSTKAPDRFLARAIDLLARDEDPKRHDLVPIDYKSLGVRHLGSIYEGLLEFKVRIATEKLAVVKQKGREVYESYSDLDDRECERAERQYRVIKKGTVYLENDKRERKATGSYYTPDYIVKYIVEHAVGPVLHEKFEAMRPRLREAQKWNKDMTKLARSKGEAESKYDHGPAVEQKWASLVDELFDIKVLDPAMGSGHFLVEAVDFITDKALDFLNSFPWNPVRAHLIEMRETILRQMDDQGINIDDKRLTDVNLLKRHVLKRCTYGVDLNPMAVELAKVSLWLNCFTLGAPLSFLDHHLRCGNSLIGVTVEEVNQSIQTGQLSLLSGNKFEGMKQAVAGMIRVGELSDVTAAEIHESRFQYRTASNAMRPAKRLLDVYTSQWFGNTPEFSRRGGKKIERNPALEFLRDRMSEEWAQNADRAELAEQWREVASKTVEASHVKRFFHWELEFPEVFYGRRPGSETLIERREDAGFDAVVGNPPYDELSEHALGRKLDEASFFEEESPYNMAGGGRVNWYHFFILRAMTLLGTGGYHGFIVPMSLLGDQFTRSVRRWILASNRLCLVEAFPQKDDPKKRVFKDAKLPTCVYIVERKDSDIQRDFRVRVHPANEILRDSPAYRGNLQVLGLMDPTNLTIPLVSEIGWRLIRRIAGDSRKGRLRDVGAVPTSGEIVFNQAFRPYLTSDPTKTLILRGSHVQRWEIVDEAKQGEPVYLRKQEYLEKAKRNSKAFHFQKPRVVYQECAAIDNWRRVIAAYLPAGYFCGHKICYFTEYKCSPLTLLAIFNSRLMDWLVTAMSSNNSLPSYLIGSLPFPAFPVENVRADRSSLVNKAQRDFPNCDNEQVGKDLRHIVEELVSRGREDVVHDLLAGLAEQMIETNMDKQTGVNNFLRWLEVQARITADEEGNVGVEVLSGKTVMKGYLGDYQKSQSHAEPDLLWDVLLRNSRRLGRSLDSAFQNTFKQEYEKNLALLLPIKAKLAATDALIDEIVYRLYGLTPEEIALVEERA